MTAEIIPYKESRALAGLAVKPPAVFLRDEKEGRAVLWFLHREYPQPEHASRLLQSRVQVFGLVRG